MSHHTPFKLFIIAGDHSGDGHAAKVAEQVYRLYPEAVIKGVGGQALKATGVELLADQSKLNRVGLESYLTIPDHLLLGQKILKELDTFQPTVVLLIDYGGFNLSLASHLKARGHQVHYFIPPQVWASRKYRIKTIQKYVDHVYCIFPFEEALYQEHGVPVTYVGHPLAGTLPPPANRTAFCHAHGLEEHRPIVAVFPGSRKSEIEYLLEPIIFGCRLIQQAQEAEPPQFVIAKANSIPPAFFQKHLNKALTALHDYPINLTVIGQENHALQSVADAAIIKSGTSTLETALYGCPMVILYKGHWLAATVARRVCVIPCWGLPNILTDMANPIVPELLQEAVTPERIRDSLLPFLSPHSPQSLRARGGFEMIRKALGAEHVGHQANPKFDATRRVAEELLKQCEKPLDVGVTAGR